VHLAMPNAKLGAKVDRYSFFVRLLPPLLHTGLARRTNIAITLKSNSSSSGEMEIGSGWESIQFPSPAGSERSFFFIHPKPFQQGLAMLHMICFDDISRNALARSRFITAFVRLVENAAGGLSQFHPPSAALRVRSNDLFSLCFIELASYASLDLLAVRPYPEGALAVVTLLVSSAMMLQK
jgi:hypothetical protein